MSSSLHALSMILVIAAVTAVLRFAPFFIFSGDQPVPEFINYLGRVLPYSIMDSHYMCGCLCVDF